MDHRIQALNVEIGKFKDFIVKFNTLFSQENFNYNLLESQFEQLRMRNAKLKEENDQAQVQIKDALDAADKIRKDAEDYARNVSMNALIQQQKVSVKLREVEGILAKAEKRQIEKHLEEVGASVAA